MSFFYFMGDFMNAEGTGQTIDLIKAEAMEEFVAHRDKYNSGGGWWGQPNNRQDIENKFSDAKKWLAGYSETDWWGNKTTVLPRTDYFYNHISQKWNLGTAVALTVNKDKQDVDIIMNDNKLSANTFDGKFFPNRTITLKGTVSEEGKAVVGWKVTGKIAREYQGSELSLQMPNGSIAINPIIGEATDIDIVETSPLNRQPSTLYDLMGNKVSTPKAGRIYIQNGKKVVWH